jgi:hypothetical protein
MLDAADAPENVFGHQSVSKKNYSRWETQLDGPPALATTDLAAVNLLLISTFWEFSKRGSSPPGLSFVELLNY